MDGRGEAARLMVANPHPMLARLFRRTPWKDGEWKRALSRMPGAFATASALNFAGVKARAWSLPLTAIPGFGEDEEGELWARRASCRPTRPTA